jgi:hypothetical protein
MIETHAPQAAVAQIRVTDELRDLTTLQGADYEDAFRAAPAPAPGRPALDAARAVLADAPADQRRLLLSGWAALGLRLGADAGRPVLGWRLRWADEEVAVLAADSPLGIEAELVFLREGGALLFATFVRLGSERAAAAWAEVEPFHPPMVRRLLERAAAADALWTLRPLWGP